MKNKSTLYQFLKMPLKTILFFLILSLNISPLLNANSLLNQCVANVVFEFDNPLNCQRTIYLNNVLSNTNTSFGGIDTTGMRIAINDITPGNGNIVDGVSPASGWNYGVFKADNSLFCQGTINSIDNFPPQLDSLAFSLIDTINFWCNDFNYVYNTNGSWSLPSSSYYTGKPIFLEGCGGPVQLIVTDVLINEHCNLFQILRRNFQAIDARGNHSYASQIINFRYPELTLFLPPSTRDTLNFNVCTAAQIQGGIDSVIRANYSAVNPQTGLFISLFDTSNISLCYYSTRVTKISNNQCPIELNTRVVVEIFDWCKGTFIKDSILINFSDNRIPFGM